MLFSDVLLTVDFDRTLTAQNSTIPERNLEAIAYFMENGGAFTVNTGRSIPTSGSISTPCPTVPRSSSITAGPLGRTGSWTTSGKFPCLWSRWSRRCPENTRT